MIHELKTLPREYQLVIKGSKTHEIRRNDRDFKTGDFLFFKEWNPDTEEYTGREAAAKISHITYGGEFGLPKDICVMSIGNQRIQ